MSHDRTYRPVLHAPAPRLRDADGSVRQVPRRYARYAEIHPVPPLKGLPGTRTTDVSYRALAPGGAGIGHRICTGASVSRLTAHYSLLTANSLTFTFSAKERDSETGLSYFGSRYYSSDLSVWLSVDPISGKYPSLSPYTYCANNPVKLVDPNGEEIEIVTTIDENGNKIITINFTAKIVNKSSHPFSKRKMEKMRDEISTGIQTYYSGQYDDATVDVNVDIICNNEEQSDDLWKEENRHSIFIVDKCSNPRWIAEAEEGGSYMNIRWNIERGANDNNLKRTAAHEFGHLLGLPDVKIEGNLMRSGGNGVNVTWGQIQEVVTNYSQHRINNGILKHYFENYRHNHH